MRVAIAGAGIGGMTLAALLERDGHEVVLVEKASVLGEVGAGIQISPNATRVLTEVGLADELARVGTMPEWIALRRWQDDTELLRRRQGERSIERYGFAYYNVYRPDLIDVLAGALGGVHTLFGVGVVGVRDTTEGSALVLADGSRIDADVVVGADGIHSVVRDSLFGASSSRFSQSVAFRALVPRHDVEEYPVEVTNWMGPDQHLVSYFVGEGRRYLNLVCVVPESRWDVEGWNEPGSLDELRAHFADWSPTVRAMLDKLAEPVHRWALHDRPPLETWAAGRTALLGDACHAMLPFMAQGACQAIEDAAVLARVLSNRDPDGVPEALDTYQRIRAPRAAMLQDISRQNAATFHMPDGPEQRARDELLAAAAGAPEHDPFAWLYEYDALSAPLTPDAGDQ